MRLKTRLKELITITLYSAMILVSITWVTNHSIHESIYTLTNATSIKQISNALKSASLPSLRMYPHVIKNLLNQTSWRRLGPNITSLFLLSAYYIFDVVRGNHSIRIISVINDEFNVKQIECFTYGASSTGLIELVKLPLSVRLLYEHRNKPYKTAYLDCQLDHVNSLDSHPYYKPIVVMIKLIDHNSSIENQNNFVLMPVTFGDHIERSFGLKLLSFAPSQKDAHLQTLESKIKEEYYTNDRNAIKLAVCVKPLYGNLSNGSRLIEFVEMYRLLGASHFTLYIHDTSPLVDKIIRYYEILGLMETIQWNLPQELLPRTERIFLDGQTATFQDCVYRYKHQSSYVAVVDIDEVLVPTALGQEMDLSIPITLLSFLSRINKTYKGKMCGSFQFRNAFYDTTNCSNNDSSKVNEEGGSPLLTMSCLWRQAHIYARNIRSKEIVIPDLIDEMGNHLTRKFVYRTFRRCRVPIELALNRHYRIPMLVDKEIGFSPLIRDVSTLIYRDRLMASIKNTIKKISGI